MAVSELEMLKSRVSSLEAEIVRIKSQLTGSPQKSEIAGEDWINKIYGAFANDSDYDKAMEIGRKYRESLRPKNAKKKPKKALKTRKRRNAHS
jgi:hypothetical protein